MKRLLFTLLISLSGVVFAQSAGNYTTLGSWNWWGYPDYLEQDMDQVDAAFLSRINASVPERVRAPQEHPEFFTDNVVTNITLNQEADVFVTFVAEGAGYRNVLGYYTYPKDSPPASISDIQSTMTIIFPNVSRLYSGGQLLPGHKVKIGHFQANTTIGWFVLANGFRPPNVTNGYWTVTSDKNLNTPSDDAKKQHVILLKDDITGRFVIAFEDIRRDRGGDEDFNDAIFYASASPANAIETGGIVDIIDPDTPFEADLGVTKSVDNNNPSDGDRINFTVTLSNAGPRQAKEIEVEDLLPPGLEFVSYTADAGTYDPDTGLWSVSSLDKDASIDLVITADVHLESISQSAFDLGPAKDFNVWVWRDFNQPSADVQGKIAVGRDMLVKSFSVGEKLPEGDGTEDVAIVGRNLIYLSGTIHGGNVVYGRNTNLPDQQVSILSGTLRKDNVINWKKSRKYLKSLSANLSKYDPTGTVIFQNNGLVLSGSEAFLNVFEVSGADLSAATSFTVAAPNGSVVLINVTGNNIDWGGALTIHGTATNNVLFNFPKARSIKIEGIDVRGSVLAPRATINFPSGVINGQIIAKTIIGTGQYNSGDNQETYFLGNIPVSKNIVNEVAIESLDLDDPNEDNDEASSDLTIAGFGDPNNIKNINWELVGTFSQSELIWKITTDKDGYLLAGTWGGKIFRSTDSGKNWNRLNSNMVVDFVWDFAVNGDNIYAATSAGVYKSTDNGSSWGSIGLAANDIRAVHFKNGTVFAGSWGSGIFTSTDEGANWTSANTGLGSNVIHSLAEDSNGNLYVGTFGAGVGKSTDGGNTWTEISVGNNFIWTLGIDGNDNIFAGTYGDGIWRSTDGSASWHNVNANLPATHIYNIRIDPNNDVYVSSWTMGVFFLESSKKKAGEIWGTLGLGGIGVSSLYFDQKDGYLYAGTGNGLLYRNGSPTVNVESEEEDFPTEFQLMQNYPNPFNPATTIEFTLPKAGYVELTIYSYLGEEIRTLVSSEFSSGTNSVVWDATDNSGKKVSSGMYIYTLKLDNQITSRKMLLIK